MDTKAFYCSRHFVLYSVVHTFISIVAGVFYFCLRSTIARQRLTTGGLLEFYSRSNEILGMTGITVAAGIMTNETGLV